MPKSVMIVEDEAAVRNLVTELVKMQNCKPFLAVDSEQAIKIVKNNRIDLALIDIGLPGEDGITLSNRIRLLDSKIEIVLMSALDITNLRTNFQIIKTIDFIRKPFHIQTMIDKIQLAGHVA